MREKEGERDCVSDSEEGVRGGFEGRGRQESGERLLGLGHAKGGPCL